MKNSKRNSCWNAWGSPDGRTCDLKGLSRMKKSILTTNAF